MISRETKQSRALMCLEFSLKRWVQYKEIWGKYESSSFSSLHGYRRDEKTDELAKQGVDKIAKIIA